MFKAIDEIKIGEWQIEKSIDAEERKDSSQTPAYIYRCLPAESNTKIGVMWLYPEKKLLRIAAFSRTGKYILEELSGLLVDNNGPAILYKFAEINAIGFDNITNTLSILTENKLITGEIKKYLISKYIDSDISQEVKAFNKDCTINASIVGSLYLYKNTLKMNLKEYQNSTCAPTEIVEVGIDNDKNQINIVVAYHYSSNTISKESYIADKLESIKIVTEVLSGQISSRDGFNKFSRQCRPGDSFIDFVMNNCRFLFEFIGQPYAESKRRLIDENLQQKLENYISALESVNKLSTCKEKKPHRLKDITAIYIMKHTNFFATKKYNPLPDDLYQAYPVLRKII